MNQVSGWLENLGAGSKVMILDSGFIAESAVKPIDVRNFTCRPMGFNAQHGTDMAEIIASRDPMSLGVAPYCDLYISKVYDGASVDWPRYEGALDWAIEIGIDVINMSFGVSVLPKSFNEKLVQLDRRGAICIAAHSRFTAFEKEPHIITACRQGPFANGQATVLGEISIRTSTGKLRTIRGNSVSTAVLSGIAACAKSHIPTMNRRQFISLLG